MWHIFLNDTQQGPFNEAQISQLIARGEATPESMVWAENMADWTPLSATPLANLLPAPSIPLQPRAHNPGLHNPYQPPRSNLQSPSATYRRAGKMSWTALFWSFKGRIPRRQYWAAFGIWIGIILILSVVAGIVSQSPASAQATMIFLLLLMIPFCWSSFAIQTKRWHDRGKSGAMLLINLIPYIGGIWSLVECGCMRGTEGTNEYGDDPT